MRRHLIGLSVAIALLSGVSVGTQAGQSTAPVQAPEQKPDQKAYSAAMAKPVTADRAAALKQFLADFPDSTMRESASLQLAQTYPTPAEKISALRAFLTDFPNTAQKDSATYQIAMAQVSAERAAALKKFIEDFPSSRLRESAEYQLTLTFTNAAEREAAQTKFITDHPKSTFAGTIYQSKFLTLVAAKPVNEAQLAAAMDGMIGAAAEPVRAQIFNTIADRLMANEVLLDRALDVIQQAVALTSEKDPPAMRAVFTTTLGQVLFKLKRYDEAGDALKKAVTISGGDGDSETQLFLGKYYEVKGDETAALAAYFKATEMGSPLDTRASLEKLYVKKYGSVASLEAKLDEMYRAKPKAFEAGHYTRPAPVAKTPARVVLAELFTGAECVPCVASDLAFDGLSERYDRETLAVLIYHLHIPGPDPMTNTDTEARAKYYTVGGTPTAVVDGLTPKVGGGGPAQAPGVFTDYKGKVEARAVKAPLATLTGFKAKVDGKGVTVTGDATLLADAADKAGHVTLRVALVENDIRYVGANGVRFHSLVVRKLLGPAEGTMLLAAGKKTAFSATADLAEVGRSLDAYLDNYEKDRQARQSGFAFKDRVDHLDSKKLAVVAFVQDEQTKEVLQAVVVGGK